MERTSISVFPSCNVPCWGKNQCLIQPKEKSHIAYIIRNIPKLYPRAVRRYLLWLHLDYFGLQGRSKDSAVLIFFPYERRSRRKIERQFPQNPHKVKSQEKPLALSIAESCTHKTFPNGSLYFFFHWEKNTATISVWLNKSHHEQLLKAVLITSVSGSVHVLMEMVSAQLVTQVQLSPLFSQMACLTPWLQCCNNGTDHLN